MVRLQKTLTGGMTPNFGTLSTRLQRVGLAGLLLLTASACTKKFEGEYADPSKAEIIDDKWNETDAKKTAEHMVKGMLEKPWLGEYTKENKRKPVLVVDTVENKTDEHLEMNILTDYIQDELINDAKVRFVAGEERQKILDQVKYQQSGVVSKQTAKNTGKQIGADFILTGNITSQVHKMGNEKSVSYFTTLQLINLETAEKVWSTKYEIKKKFHRAGAGW